MAKKPKKSSFNPADYEVDEGDLSPAPLAILARMNQGLETNVSQTQDKLETNLSQTQVEPKSDSNLGQTQVKLETNLSQKTEEKKPKSNLRQTEVELKSQPKTNLSRTEVKPETNLGQTQVKLETQLKSEPKTNLSRTQDKPKSKKLYARKISSLSGQQKDALLFIFNNCLDEGSRISAPIAIENLAEAIKSTVGTARKQVQRLEKERRFIDRYDWKDGQGGWTQYEIFEDIYAQLILQTKVKLETNLSQTQVKLETQLRTEPKTSSTNNNRNFSKNLIISIPENVKSYVPEDLITDALLTQKISAQKIQESLDALSLDVSNKKKFKYSVQDLMRGLFASGKSYHSEQYRIEVQRELQAELKRIDESLEAKRKLEEITQKHRFEEYKAQNPTWTDVYRAKWGAKVSDQRLEQLAFEDFKRTQQTGSGEL